MPSIFLILGVLFSMGVRESVKYEQLEFDIGQGLTLNEYSDVLHNEKDGFVTVCQKVGDEWSERNCYINTWKDYIKIDPSVNLYSSVNTFYKPVRNNDNLRQLNSLYIDLDIYNKGLGKEQALTSIEFLVQTERIPMPTFIIDSGRGLYMYWVIESAPGKFKNVLKLYGHIQSFLYDMTKDLGADPNALDPSRVLRIPGSFNTKSNTNVKILEYNEDKIYTLRFMQQFMNEAQGIDWSKIQEEIKERKKGKKNNKGKSKIKRLFTFYSLAISRARDLENICFMRNYNIIGYRNTLLHIYAYQMMLIHQNYNVAKHRTKELNEKLKQPLSKQDINDICKSVHKAYEEHLKDSNKGYNYKNETIIEKLDITAAEQRKMQVLIDSREKNERDKERKRRQRRNKDGLTTRQARKQELITKVKELSAKGLKQAEIAKEIGIKQGTVSKYLRE